MVTIRAMNNVVVDYRGGEFELLATFIAHLFVYAIFQLREYPHKLCKGS